MGELLILEKVESTQDEAFELLDERDYVAVLALEQTGGRGRKGRKWISRRGGLYLSIGWRGLSIEEASRLVFSIPVAVVELLKRMGIEGRIKIPNDILVSRRKICGILVENRQDKTVAGIGLNINQRPNEIVEGATSVFVETGREYEVIETARRLIKLIEEWRNMDFYKVLEEYKKHLLRGHFRFRYRGKEVEDYIMDVDESLMVIGERGRYNIYWMEEVRV